MWIMRQEEVSVAVFFSYGTSLSTWAQTGHFDREVEYQHLLRERLGDPDWSLSDDTRIVCQRFRLVERFAEPISPEDA